MQLKPTCVFLVLTLILSGDLYAQTEAVATPADQQIASFEDLVELLNRDGITHQTMIKDKKVAIPTKKGAVEGVMVIRWADQDGVVHFLQTMGIQPPEDRIPAIESAIVRLNHVQPTPGLSYNHTSGHVYFRLTVPLVPRKSISTGEVRVYFQHALRQSVRWHPIVKAVVDGRDPKSIVEYAANLAKTKVVIPVGKYACNVRGAKWVLEFDKNGQVTVSQNGKEMAKSQCTFEGNQVTLVDISGEAASKEKGVYRFESNGDELTFRRVQDNAGGRAAVLSSTLWKKVDARTEEGLRKERDKQTDKSEADNRESDSDGSR